MLSVQYIRLFCLQLCCCLLLAVTTAVSQSAWQHIGVNEGLAQGFVLAMKQDSKGFMWFGTNDGLSRYDGYTFKNYRNDPLDSTTIASGTVAAIHECKTGSLWIGFLAGNIDIFDRRTERFIHLHAVPWFPTVVKQLFSISEDSSGTHWIGRVGEILEIPKLSKPSELLTDSSFHVIIHKEFLPEHSNKQFNVTYVDHANRIWVWDNNHINVVNQSLPKLPDLPAGRMILRMWENDVNEDRDGNLWFSVNDSMQNFLYTYYPRTGATKLIATQPIDFSQGNSFIHSNKSGEILWIVRNTCIKIDVHNPLHQVRSNFPYLVNVLSSLIDSGGIVWFGSAGYGIEKYNPAVERFGAIPNMPFQSLAREVMELGGFPRRNGFSNTVTPYFDLYDYFVFSDRHGKIWYPNVMKKNDISGNFGEVLCYDSLHKKLIRFPRQKVLESITSYSFPMSEYIKMLTDNDGTTWFLGWRVLSAYDDNQNRFRHYVIRNGVLSENKEYRADRESHITAVQKDKDGGFWLGVFQEGLYKFDPVTLSLKRYAHNQNDTTTVSSDNILAITEDPADPDHYFWIGTDGGGLNKFEKATGRCKHFTTRNGLPNNVVYTIFPDKKVHLWMSTNSGICRFDPRTVQFKYYDIHDGLQGMEFNRERNFQTTDGRIYLEGTGGMNVFYPEDIIENTHVPNVVFTDVMVRGISIVLTNEDYPFPQSITEIKEIVLPFEQNIVTFEYAALDYSNPGSNEFSYRLEGFNDEWTKPSTVHTATFTNLSPGTYTLHVRASNNDGLWNETGASIRLIILPPWYRTWWAYTGYIGLVVVGLFLFRRYDLKRIRLKDQLVLEQSRSEQLKEVDQLKMQFFQNISHEFRTPLTLILGPIEKLLSSTSVPEDTQKRELRMMRRNAQRLLRLINQLLDLSKLEAGGMKLRATQDDIIAFIKGVTMSFHSLAERKEIYFDVQTDMENVDLDFDKEKMEKIIINLLSNAFKFTPDHGEVIVSVSQTSNEDWVRIAVRDTGIGISQEKLSHIFDRFYQVDSSSTRMQEGTGIGLALVKELVNLHRGTITVTSEPGKGSEFIVSLPVGKSHLQRNEIVETEIVKGSLSYIQERELLLSETTVTVEQFTPENSGDDKPILLIIEDNADVRQYIRSYLHQSYSVFEAPDGAAGVEKAKELIPDLIISDVMMPKMDGYEVCGRLKQDEKTSHIPIILLTAKAAKEDKIGGLETGADDYLIKPFDSTELLVRVKNLIETRRKLREKFGKELVTLKPAEIAVNSVEQGFLAKVMEAIERHIGEEEFGVNELADTIGLSSKQLQRKLKGLANTTAAECIRSFRLQRAKELLQKDSTTIAEVAYSVGFSSPAYFSKCFSEQFGVTPSEARKGDQKIQKVE